MISLYSVEFLQFLLATPLHWIHANLYLFVYLFVCVQSASYSMHNIAAFGTIFLRLIFYSFEPYPYHYHYSYTYPIILTSKIYQSVVLEVVQLFQVGPRLVSG